MLADLVEGVAQEFFDGKIPSKDWDWDGLAERMSVVFGLEWEAPAEDEREDLDLESLEDLLLDNIRIAYDKKEIDVGQDTMRHLERVILLQIVDNRWKDHLLGMDHLKEGIGLRGYGQKNPLDEYKKEGFDAFINMIEGVKQQTVSTLFRIQLAREDEVAELEQENRRKRERELEESAKSGEVKKPVQRKGRKIGRNAPCPCGSGKKYKKCCGRAK
jgi:preprotein translocase subunit SecA